MEFCSERWIQFGHVALSGSERRKHVYEKNMGSFKYTIILDSHDGAISKYIWK